MEEAVQYKINCPFCGKRVCKIEFDSKVEIECNSCKALLTISIKKNKVIIESNKIIK